MGGLLFISYAHADMTPTHWLDRLKTYLAPLRRQEVVDFWDDTRIQPGTEWSVEIDSALHRASAAILLVGPEFLRSEFIERRELPPLLSGARMRGVKIFPLVIGYCGYDRSPLATYQAFNDPNNPLEDLERPKQNKTLNELAKAVDDAMRHAKPPFPAAAPPAGDLRAAMTTIRRKLGDTKVAFEAQVGRRDNLVNAMTSRLRIPLDLEYERFFFRHSGKMNAEEKFLFDQIRAMTEGPLREGNQAVLDSIERNPAVLDAAPLLADVRQHLVFWLNKYDRIFARTPEMCVLYTGVEDGVPFPSGVDDQVARWFKSAAAGVGE